MLHYVLTSGCTTIDGTRPISRIHCTVTWGVDHCNDSFTVGVLRLTVSHCAECILLRSPSPMHGRMPSGYFSIVVWLIWPWDRETTTCSSMNDCVHICPRYPEMCKATGFDCSKGDSIPFSIVNKTYVYALEDIVLKNVSGELDFWWIDWQQGIVHGWEALLEVHFVWVIHIVLWILWKSVTHIVTSVRFA